MLTTEDFTAMPEGLFVPLAGPIRRCPRCERNGVETVGSGLGTSTFVHVQTCDVMGDGMLVEPQDCCVTFRPDLPRSLSLVAFRV
jgi:hypothetical protein